MAQDRGSAGRVRAEAGGISGLPVLDGSSTLSTRLYDVLEEAIISGALPAGQRIHADDIAAHYGMSRIPVRETFRALDAAGWVQLRPRQGAYVRRRTTDELSALFETRLLLESESAARAAERSTPDHVAELERILAAQREAFTEGDQVGMARLNNQFHAAVALSAGNSVLADLIDGLSKRVRFYFATVANNQGRRSMSEHARLIEALRTRDADAAVRVARDHVQATRTAVDKLLEQETSP